MKPNTLTCILPFALFTTLAMPNEVVAQSAQYKLIDLGSILGSTTGLAVPGRPLNSGGTLAFAACVNPDCSVFHSFTWRNNVITDLGSGLPGGSGPIWISDSGLVLSNGGMTEQRGVIFSRGNAIDIGTLEGGNESFGSAVNDSGAVVGVASNSVPDPFSLFGYATQTRAVLWFKGTLSDLGTLGGPDSIAGNVNEGGQVAGLSYTDATANPTTGLPTVHPFLWDRGKMIDLGTLGGVFGVPGSFGAFTVILNNRGQVVGTSDLAGDQIWHPFLWERGVLKDLGTLGGSTGQSTCINDAGEIVGEADLPGDLAHDAFLWKNGVMSDLGNLGRTSFAFSINEKGQVVGRSRLDATTVHAFIWEKGGPMVDLNSLIAPGASLELTDAFQINDRGEIAGMGVPPGCASEDECGHAYVLVPVGAGDPGDTANVPQYSQMVVTSTPSQSRQRRGAAIRLPAAMRARLADR